MYWYDYDNYVEYCSFNIELLNVLSNISKFSAKKSLK